MFALAIFEPVYTASDFTYNLVHFYLELLQGAKGLEVNTLPSLRKFPCSINNSVKLYK